MTKTETKLLDTLVSTIVNGYDYDPGDSDLDDEQSIFVRMTLGDYRRAVGLKVYRTQ